MMLYKDSLIINRTLYYTLGFIPVDSRPQITYCEHLQYISMLQ